MKLVASRISPDEPCWGLFEGPTMVPQIDGSAKERWVQDVKVIRGDAIAHYTTDLGPADDYRTVTPMLMPSFGENTVAQLQFFAEKNRHDDYWQKRAGEMLAGSTLISDHIRQYEQDSERIKNRSVFGPMVSSQRNGYSRTANYRRWNDKRAQRTGKVQI